MDALSKEHLLELHRPLWSGTWVWFLFFAAFFLSQGMLLAILLSALPWYVQVPAVTLLVLVLGHLMHGHLIAFHEAAHGSLCPVRWVNEVLGILVGLFSFMSLSIYRAAHHSHHAYLGTERDEELWPFVIPGTPRWARRLAACLELTIGLAYTPFLFLRAFLRPGTVIRDRSVRLRIWAELAFIAAFWGALLAVVAWWNLWSFWLVMYLMPAILAGNMQSLRKYIEHMGLTGATPLGATRSVLAPNWVGRVVAFSLFNEPYHGVHHKYARLPQGALPRLASALTPETAEELAPYPSYRRAFWDMLRTFGDPRVGSQWLPGRGSEGKVRGVPAASQKHVV
jgi:fatty acid desaturase